MGSGKGQTNDYSKSTIKRAKSTEILLLCKFNRYLQNQYNFSSQIYRYDFNHYR